MSEAARRVRDATEEIDVRWPKHTWTTKDAFCIIPEAAVGGPRHGEEEEGVPKLDVAPEPVVGVSVPRMHPRQRGLAILTNLVTRRKYETVPDVTG